MKVLSVLTVSALALVCSVDRAAGAACSLDDAKKMVSLVSKILADENCLKTTTSKCPNAECLKTMEAVYAELPDCTSEGKNSKTEFASQLKDCGVGSAAPASAPFSTAATVALSSAAVAVAAVYL